MKIVAINCTGQSGGAKVMFEVAKIAMEKRHDYYTFTPKKINKKGLNNVDFSRNKEHTINSILGQFFGYDNAILKKGTKRLLNYIGKIQPDVIHLHGLHNWSLDYKMLFKYINSRNIPIIWTQHDTWNYTGKCTYYTIANCNKWKTGCYECPQLLEYPKSLIFDNSKRMYNYKRNVFTNISNLTLVAVSNWLESEIKQSFLNTYEIKVIENGIDTSVFKYNDSQIRSKYGLEDKFIVLSVASGWSKRKGLDDIIDLADRLSISKQDNIKIVVIGVSVEQSEICEKKGILSLNRTNDIEELVNWYSTANVFFNPSIEESFGLVTVEAMACGTPVIVYDSTASPEIVKGTNSIVVKVHDITEVIKSINFIISKGKSYFSESSRTKIVNSYDSRKQYLKYLDLYLEKAINEKETKNSNYEKLIG